MPTMNESSVEHHACGGTSFVGPDAVLLARAITLKGALRMYSKFKMLPTRGVSATDMLTMAGQYSGKKYKRGQYDVAADDVAKWIDIMKGAIPTTVNGEQV